MSRGLLFIGHSLTNNKISVWAPSCINNCYAVIMLWLWKINSFSLTYKVTNLQHLGLSSLLLMLWQPLLAVFIWTTVRSTRRH